MQLLAVATIVCANICPKRKEDCGGSMWIWSWLRDRPRLVVLLFTLNGPPKPFSLFAMFATFCLVLRACPLLACKGDLRLTRIPNMANIVLTAGSRKDEMKVGCTATLHLTTGITGARINFSTMLIMT